MTRVSSPFLCGVCLAVSLSSPAVYSAPPQSANQVNPPTTLLTPESFQKHWVPFAEGDRSAANTWVLKTPDPQASQPSSGGAALDKGPWLVCTGKPEGYLRTARTFQDFAMRLEWRYPTDPNGNSGILLYGEGKDQLWPRSVQIQLHIPSVGSVFPTSGARTSNVLAPARFLNIKPQAWNTVEVVSLAGSLRISMNGQLLGDVVGCEPQAGFIALQSEGSEIQFRNIQIRDLTNADRQGLLAPVTIPVRSTAQSRRALRWNRRLARQRGTVDPGNPLDGIVPFPQDASGGPLPLTDLAE